jgi:hypothetical protein
VFIDFESYFELDPVGSVGIATFSNATVLMAGSTLNEFQFPPKSDFNVASDVSYDPATDVFTGAPMRIVFATPVLAFSGFFTYLAPLTIQAFDASNNPIAGASATSQFDANDALFSGNPPNEFLEIASVLGNIRSIVITGDPAGGSFTVDDVTFEPAELPEPATWFLLGGAAVTCGIRQRRKSIRRR